MMMHFILGIMFTLFIVCLTINIIVIKDINKRILSNKEKIKTLDYNNKELLKTIKDMTENKSKAKHVKLNESGDA